MINIHFPNFLFLILYYNNTYIPFYKFIYKKLHFQSIAQILSAVHIIFSYLIQKVLNR